MAEQATVSASRNQLREFRVTVANVVANLRSKEVRDTYATITITELVEQQLAFLTGTKGQVPSQKQRLTAAYEAFNNAISAIKATPPAAFRQHDPSTDVNTASDAR